MNTKEQKTQTADTPRATLPRFNTVKECEAWYLEQLQALAQKHESVCAELYLSYGGSDASKLSEIPASVLIQQAHDIDISDVYLSTEEPPNTTVS